MLQEFKIVLDCLDQPAFIRDSRGILLVNPAAQALGLTTGEHPVLEQLPWTLELCQCTLSLAGQSFAVSLRPAGELQLAVCQPLADLDQQVLASAASSLRQPLHKMVSATSGLWPYLEAQEDERIQAGTAAVSHGIYQLLRAVNNLADLYLPEDSSLYRRKRTECNYFLGRFMERVTPLVESTGRWITLECQTRCFYALLDVAAVERALLNFVANAIAHTPKGETITLRGWREEKYCCFAVTNPGQPVTAQQLSGIFGRYAREDLALLEGGTGFGMQIAGNVARSHHGTLLVRAEDTGGLTVVLSVEAAEVAFGEAPIRTPQMPVERSGGFDRYLIELADVLDDTCYDSRNID